MELATNADCNGLPIDQAGIIISRSVAAGVEPSANLVGMLEGCRQYLLMVANEVIGPNLQAKFGASDLVQDTFLEAQNHLSLFRGKTSAEMRAWLRKILECRLSNLRRAYLATEKRAAGREVTLNSVQGDAGAGIELLACPAPSPSKHAVQNEWSAALEKALVLLPDRYQKAVTWRHIEQLSWDEIGKRMHCSAEAARKTWSRAIQQLRRELGEHGSML